MGKQEIEEEHQLKSRTLSEPPAYNGERSAPKTLEKPKIASSSRKRDALLWTSIYHLPPVIITALYTVVYFQQWTWPSPGPSEEALAALQFVAKVHECIVVASLSNVLYHRVRHLLMRTDGLPLGLVTSSFEVSNPLYFLSSAFLASLRTLLSSFPIFFTFGLLGAVAVLSVAANPFSAILLLPRSLVLAVPESHWLMRSLLADVPNPWLKGPADGQGYYLADTLAIPVNRFPSSMGPELGVNWTCPDIPDRPGNCVSYFQTYFPDLFLKLLGTDDAPGTQSPGNHNGFLNLIQHYDLIVSEPNLRTTPIGFSFSSSVASDSSGDRISMVTCPLLTAAVDLQSMQFGILSATDFHTEPSEQLNTISSVSFAFRNQTLPTKQPRVLAQLCAHMINSTKPTMDYLTSGANWGGPMTNPGDEGVLYGCFGTGLYPAFRFSMPEEIAAQILEQNWETGFTLFVDLQGQIPYPISGGFISLAANKTGDQGIRRLNIGFFVASFADAGPTSRKLFGGVSQSPVVPGELSNPLVTLINMTADSVGPVVRMDASWLNSLDIFPFEVLPQHDMARLDNTSRSLFTQLASTDMDQLEAGIAAFVASVMSAVDVRFGALPAQRLVCSAPQLKGCTPASFGSDPGYTGPSIVYTVTEAVPEDELGLPENQLQVRVKVEQLAYGYSFRGVTVFLSFVFLFSHVLVVLYHAIVIVVGGFWNTTAWSSMTDLIVLGINSTPSDLVQNTGAGVGKWRTWTLSASIRNVKKEQRLEFVVCDADRGEYRGLEGREKPNANAQYS
ncbi:hypothetical protein B0T24DRAFT_708781 [Lasiosphaeria ovina]|uniref:Uncharacterized protein n=1 Tax=Lasiosphaeria ovina TaxID=92902 RepID=A0AAE0N4E9_9PEZI|nr:hypothetical protein B0T24DRAFT_708781 [Lasiosphaeria ovina]